MDGSDITLEVDVDESIPVTNVEADADQHEEAEEVDELPIQTPPLKGKFVPFQGKGYVLGGR
jgi:hypothetical protein